MNKLLITCAAAALSAGLLSSAYAQDASQPMTPTQGQQTTPSSQYPQTAPSSPSTTAAQADLTGQTIYSSKGTKIGAVSSMNIGAKGEQDAVVSVGRFLGMGGKNIEFPVSSLTARDGGGYTTSLTSAEIKKLPEYKGGGKD